VNLRLDLLIQPELACVARHSHNGLWGWPEQQPASDRVLARKETTGKGFIDDCDMRRSGAILIGDGTSGAHPHAHSPKVARAYAVDFEFAFNWPPTFNLKPHLAKRTPGEGKKAGQAGRLHAGHGPDAGERFFVIGLELRRSRRIFGLTGQERERQYAF